MSTHNSEFLGKRNLSSLILTKIRETRDFKNITQEDMGLRLGISKGSYSEIENGKRGLTLDRFLEIIDILEIDDVFGKGQNNNKPSEDEVLRDTFAKVDDNILTEFRKQVKQYRKKLFTQSEIAEKLGISQVAYSKIESGETNLSLQYARQLIELLNIENPFLSAQNSELPFDMLIAQNSLLKEYFEMELRHTEDRVQFLKKVLSKEEGNES